MTSAKYKNGDHDTEARAYSLLGEGNLLASYYASGSMDEFLNAPERQSNRDAFGSDVSRSAAKPMRAYDAPTSLRKTSTRDHKHSVPRRRGSPASSDSLSPSSRYADAETGISSPRPAQFSLERELLERERELLEKERLLARRDRELRERELRERDARRRIREQQRLERNGSEQGGNVSHRGSRHDHRQQVEMQRHRREKELDDERQERLEQKRAAEERQVRLEQKRAAEERQYAAEQKRAAEERQYAAEQKQRTPRNASLSQRKGSEHARQASEEKPQVPGKDEKKALKPVRHADSAQRPAKEKTDKGAGTGPIDIIDRLDVSGIYGGGSFYKHDGPYAAAMAAASTSPAFTADTLDPMAQLKSSAEEGGYGAAAKGVVPSSGGSLSMLAANSSTSGGLSSQQTSFTSAENGNADRIEMGFPAGRMKQKERELAEMYGLRDLEAWEDFGTSSVEHMDAAPAASISGGTPRAGDMEATLRSSASTRRRPLKTPTHLSNAPPPAPIDLSAVVLNPGFPENEGSNEDYTLAGNTYRGPQRSKSLKQRLRSLSVREKPAARKNNAPFDSPAALRANQSLPTSNDEEDEVVSPSTSLDSYRDDFFSPAQRNIHWGALPHLAREDEKKGKGIARFLKLGKK